MAIATPAPSKKRFLITLPPAANTRPPMVTPPPLRHVYNLLLLWQSLFSSPSPSIAPIGKNAVRSDIRATVWLRNWRNSTNRPRHLRNTAAVLNGPAEASRQARDQGTGRVRATQRGAGAGAILAAVQR